MGRPESGGPVFFVQRAMSEERADMAGNQNEILTQQLEKLDALRGYL
jgi:hypothetical protein